MSSELGAALPDDLFRLLGGAAPADTFRQVLVLTSVDADGAPRHALLSPYEVVARSPSRLLVLLYRTSRSSANLAERPRLALLAVDPSMSYCVIGSARALPGLDEAPREALFEVAVTGVREDRLPTARIASGITFEGHDPGMVPEDRRRVLARLRRL